MKRVGDTRLSPAEAAQLLGVGVEQVRAWCESGQLPSYKSIHGWRLIDRKELIAFTRAKPELFKLKPRRV